MKVPFDIVVFDLETNGRDIPDVRIVEIGAVRLDRNLEIRGEFSMLVDGRPMTPGATSVNTITDRMLEGQPRFEEAWPRFVEFCGPKRDYVLAAWGAYYDVCVLRAEYRRVGIRYPHPGRALDVKAIAWFETWKRGDPSSSGGLQAVLGRFGLPFEGTRHRALDDARMTARILVELARGRGEK